MAEVEKLLLQIDAQTTLLRQELAKARSSVDDFANSTERKLGGLDGAFGKLGAGGGALIRSLGGIAAGFIGVSQAAGLALNSTREFQKLSAMLEVATGSAGKATEAFDGLAKFAAETPFTLTQVTEAYIRLKNLGIEPTEARLRSFGNTSAAMGKDLMQFIEAVADASTGEFERLKEFGIRASKEGDKVRFTFQGVTEKVKFNADAISDYLQRIGESKFGDAMAKQAETIDGKLSNLSDATAGLGRALGGLGISSATTAGIEALTVLIKDATRATEGLGQGLSSLARSAINLFDRAAGVDAPRERGPSAEATAKRRERDLATINALPTGSAIRAAKEAEYRTRYGIAQDMALQEDAMITVSASRKMEKVKTRGGTSKTVTKKPTWLEQARAGTFDTPMAMPDLTVFKGDLPQIATDIDKIYTDLEGISELPPIKPINPISEDVLETTRKFAENLSSGLAQAIIYGQDLGKALVNSIKAAAAQLVASKLLELLGGIGGKIFGGGVGGIGNIFKRESGGPVKAGQPYVVGEKRPELFVPTSSGYIHPKVPGGKGEGAAGVNVTVSPSPLFEVVVAQTSTRAGQQAARQTMRQASRSRLPSSMGA